MDHEPSALLGLFVLFVLLFFYFFPAMVAAGRQHRDLGAIIVVNLFLGWTLLGWVAAMAWALIDRRRETIVMREYVERQSKDWAERGVGR